MLPQVFRKTGFKLILFLLFFFIAFKPVQAEVIRDFQSESKILKDGTVDVVEYIEYDFEYAQRHGIFRYIPYIAKHQDGKKYVIDIDVNEVIDENGNKYKWKVSRSSSTGDLTIKIGDPDRYVTGLKKYIIHYHTAGAIDYFSDHDEYYWNATGTGWQVVIEKSLAKVVLPELVDDDKLQKKCFTGAFGSKVSDCEISVQGNEIYYQGAEAFGPGEGLTTVAGFPKGVVAVREAKEYVDFADRWYGKLIIFTIAIVFGLALLFWYVCYPLWIIIKWFRYGRDPKVTIGVTRASFDAPKLPSGRVLTPGESGSLTDEVVDNHDISATLVDMARRGFLRIEEKKKKDFYLHKKKSDTSKLLSFEKHLFDGIFKTADSVRLKDAHLYTTVYEAKNMIYNSMVTDGLFPKNPSTIRGFYIAMGILALVTANIPLAVIAFVFGWAMPRKTVLGKELANRAKSLKNFLTSQERQLTFQAKNKLLFEKLLPFAVAFGVEKIWAERFKDINLKEPSWYSSYDSGGFNSVYFTHNLNRSFTSFASAATPVTSSTGHSSGFSSGGGFSGGGGGGGGGGSW